MTKENNNGGTSIWFCLCLCVQRNWWFQWQTANKHNRGGVQDPPANWKALKSCQDLCQCSRDVCVSVCLCLWRAGEKPLSWRILEISHQGKRWLRVIKQAFNQHLKAVLSAESQHDFLKKTGQVNQILSSFFVRFTGEQEECFDYNLPLTSYPNILIARLLKGGTTVRWVHNWQLNYIQRVTLSWKVIACRFSRGFLLG